MAYRGGGRQKAGSGSIGFTVKRRKSFKVAWVSGRGSQFGLTDTKKKLRCGGCNGPKKKIKVGISVLRFWPWGRKKG